MLPAELDADSWLLNVKNGTIDLRTGELRPHRREDLITSLATVKYDPAAACPLWTSILDRIFDRNAELITDPKLKGAEATKNAELIGFWRRLCGLSLTGVVTEQVLPILWGAGANGKSTILKVLLEMLGPDYSLVAPPGLLIVRNGEHHPTERAALFGKRLVVDLESAEGARLNENLVKQLTGSDKISARLMREDFWEFEPTHKLMMCTNHRPEIRETKNAIWRRLKLIPFEVVIADADQIRDLTQRLQAEHAGILAWCVQGCLEWQHDGLGVPDKVALATQEYRADEDLIAGFLAEECTINDQLNAKATPLYLRYKSSTERIRDTIRSHSGPSVSR